MPQRKAYLRRARQWIANRGFRSFLQVAAQRAWNVLLRRPIPGQVRPDTGPHPFDQAYGVDTTGLVFGEALFDGRDRTAKSQGAQYWVTGYYGVAPSAFTAALGRLDLPWREFTFVDIGCGKGRAMLLALRYPFRAVCGVELAPVLAAAAEENLRGFEPAWRQPGITTRVVTGDATKVDLPAGPLVLFLYHPFAGPVMKQFLAHVKQALENEARPVYVLYANPELAPEMLAMPNFTPLWRDVFPFDAEDVQADRFGSTYEQFAAFEVLRIRD